MNPVLDRMYAEGRVRDTDGVPVAAVKTAVQPGSGRLLYDLVRREGLARTVEVGLAYGASTLFLCQAHADNGAGRHTAIDPFQTANYDRLGVENVERAGLSDHFEWVDAPSYAALAAMVEAERGTVDLVFIDGSHKFDYALVDFFYADLLVREGGYVVFDDLWMPAVLRAVHFVLQNRDYSVPPVEAARYSSWGRRVARSLRRLGTAPLTLDRRLRRYPLNTIVLRKERDDRRPWDFHRAF